MKRGTPDHPKTLKLQRALGCNRVAAVGCLELLFHWAAKYAPQGDVGRWSNEDIATGVGWEGDPHAFVKALTDAGFLDERPIHRLVVHDWHEHADDATKKHLARTGKTFLSNEKDALARPTVYVVQAKESGRIKIGYTEGAVESRMRALQTGSPEQLALLCSYPGSRKDEAALHQRFSRHALSGEWFVAAPEILAFVSDQAAATVRRLADGGATAADGVTPAVAVALALPLTPTPLTPRPTAGGDLAQAVEQLVAYAVELGLPPRTRRELCDWRQRLRGGTKPEQLRQELERAARDELAKRDRKTAASQVAERACDEAEAWITAAGGTDRVAIELESWLQIHRRPDERVAAACQRWLREGAGAPIPSAVLTLTSAALNRATTANDPSRRMAS